MSFKINPLLAADSYKFNHINMYPEGITEVYSNFTPRSVRHLNVPVYFKDNKITWFGAQAVVQDMVEMWQENFFNLSDEWVNLDDKTELDVFVEEFSRIIAPFAGANYAVNHLYALHALGYLPLEIKTLSEGSLVPVGVPVLTVRNTKPEFFWLTNFIESYLSAELWKMSTTATIARYYRKVGTHWYKHTGANMAMLDFAIHDFSFRGMGGTMDAAKSASGHLVYFKGTDSVPAIPYIEYHYLGKNTFIGASVPATEHSIQTAFVENDLDYFDSMITKYTTGIVSVVADGYDYWNVLTSVLPALKDKIMARQPDAMGFNKLVIRPDSGDPIRIIAGYEDFEVEVAEKELGRALTQEEIKGSVQVLWELFGGTVNDKGFKTLDQHIGLIYGDSITLDRADEIYTRLKDKGFAADNIVFGVGSFTYQYNTRDTLGFAMKATNITQNGKDIPLFKDPKTDSGTKKSAKGLLRVAKVTLNELDGPSLVLIDNVSREDEDRGELTILFHDGVFHKQQEFEEIREVAMKEFN